MHVRFCIICIELYLGRAECGVASEAVLRRKDVPVLQYRLLNVFVQGWTTTAFEGTRGGRTIGRVCLERSGHTVEQVHGRRQGMLSLFFFFCISLTADGPQRARLPIPTIATLPSCLWSLRIFPSLPDSRLTIFLSRCKLRTLTPRQTMVGFYHLLTFSRFPLRKPEYKSYFEKNRTHDFRTTSKRARLPTRPLGRSSRIGNLNRLIHTLAI